MQIRSILQTNSNVFHRNDRLLMSINHMIHYIHYTPCINFHKGRRTDDERVLICKVNCTATLSPQYHISDILNYYDHLENKTHDPGHTIA